jgi:hypothetical protein
MVGNHEEVRKVGLEGARRRVALLWAVAHGIFGARGCVSRRFLGGRQSAMGRAGKGRCCVCCVCLRGSAMALSITFSLCLCLSKQRDCRGAGDCGRDGDVRYMSKGGSNNKRGFPFCPLWMG